jgi:serine/threonine protein kinase
LIANRPVGLWMLPPHVGTSRSMLATLQRDFARLRTLDHPHIARMVELGNNGQQYYVTGERLDGEPLREVLTHLAPERVEIGEADDIIRSIGSALVYAHDHGVAHGDVRAENVLVTMDRRFVLTNFIARRVAKAAARPPRAADDVKGLARLAAELYTGSASLEAIRAAAHGTVPAARLNAIRGVLEASGRRSGSVADFLAAAGLSFAAPMAAAAVRHTPKPQRSRPLWRVALPMAALAAVGAFVASYYPDVGTSAEELKVRGLDALRTVAGRVAPTRSREEQESKIDVDVPPQGAAAADSERALETRPLKTPARRSQNLPSCR